MKKVFFIWIIVLTASAFLVSCDLASEHDVVLLQGRWILTTEYWRNTIIDNGMKSNEADHLTNLFDPTNGSLAVEFRPNAAATVYYYTNGNPVSTQSVSWVVNQFDNELTLSFDDGTNWLWSYSFAASEETNSSNFTEALYVDDFWMMSGTNEIILFANISNVYEVTNSTTDGMEIFTYTNYTNMNYQTYEKIEE